MGVFSLVFAASAALLIALLTFYALRRTLITTSFRLFIDAKPADVFNYAKDPNNIPAVQYSVISVNVQRLLKDPDGTEHRQYEMRENIQHVGPHIFQVHSSADIKQLRISKSAVYLYGLVEAHVMWKFSSLYNDDDGSNGTLLVERAEILVPMVLKKFFNRTIETTHREALRNLKYVMEKGDDAPRMAHSKPLR